MLKCKTNISMLIQEISFYRWILNQPNVRMAKRKFKTEIIKFYHFLGNKYTLQRNFSNKSM